ncbi:MULTISPECIES: class E sortase [unclassified Isoptericola]|uniref:class E sortase n=1 Tax=unclassified Isoptericola TaxID=2623355 RepID=UPI00271285F2|nr:MULTISPECIES: class E sortase [unclassified Isoptericola]MDO8147643.1 class E sortase [Isoptericola sp. b515]MDO8150057.1 class E sortase [Isoptericola sp. b408]
MRHATGAGAGRRGGAFSTVIGVFGELLITAGVVLGLFVVWQLWWTDVQAERIHSQVLAELDWPEPPAAEVPSGNTAAEGPAVASEHRGEPPAADDAAFAEVFAQFYVPRFGTDYVEPIAEGIDKATVLDRLGIGHYPDSANPGELGNFAMAGHRTTYGRPFHQIADLREGDALVVRTRDTWYVYKMTSSQIVWPNQVEVVSPVPGVRPGEPLPELTQRFLTMTACHPMYSAAQRYVVHGELDYWAPVDEGVPAELLDAGVEIQALADDDAGVR